MIDNGIVSSITKSTTITGNSSGLTDRPLTCTVERIVNDSGLLSTVERIGNFKRYEFSEYTRLISYCFWDHYS